MPLFEITLVLLTIAVVLMRLAKALRVPYPSLPALAGGRVAVLPFAPHLVVAWGKNASCVANPRRFGVLRLFAHLLVP